MKFKRTLGLILAACIALSCSIPGAMAQLEPTATAGLAVTTSSARVALPSTDPSWRSLVIWNVGTNEAFVKLGNASVTAATTDVSIPAGAGVALNRGLNTNLAAITASGTATLRITQGAGLPVLAGGGGGAVTQGTSPWVISGPADVRASATISSGTLNAAVTVNLNNGEGVTAFAVSGLTGSGATLTIEASDDGGTTWAGVNGIQPATGVLIATLTTDQQFRVNTGGRTNVRVRVSTNAGAQTITVATNASSVGSAVALSSPLPAGTNNIGAVSATLSPSTTGGNSVYFVQPTASDNHAVIKNGAGQVYKVMVTNNSATVNYLRLYDAGTGFNGCNSATGLKYQVAIPASTSVGGISDSWNFGMAFATGISICVTSGYATNDTTNATASAMSVNIGYQ